MKAYLLRGVPASLQMDAWWMSSGDPEISVTPAKPGRGSQSSTWSAPFHMVVLLALILLADWLFWGHRAGLSLVLFAVALIGGIWAISEHRISVQKGTLVMAGLIAGLLPLLIYVQLVSVMFYGATLIGFAAWIVLQGRGKAGEMLQAGLRFVTLAPMQAVRDMVPVFGGIRRSSIKAGVVRNLLLAWALPVGVGSVFLALLIAGNPMFSHWANQLPAFNADLGRLAFWLLIAALVWPFLVLPRLRQRMLLPFLDGYAPRLAAPALFNAGSVMNSLVLFNLIFATQTGLDMVYLWGGASLPEDMSHATYAHRGAYPLVATALLAGIFALVSRAFVQDRRGMRRLLLLWLAQNLALVAGAIQRLDLYVGAFGLTYLRLAAFIWMGMVAAGLLLIGWQLLRNKGNGWLLARMSVLLVAVLYVCSMVNFANMIAASNLSRGQTVQDFLQMDRPYICQLGPMALPAIRQYERQYDRKVCTGIYTLKQPKVADWREWGFRKWQVRRYLVSQMPVKDAP